MDEKNFIIRKSDQEWRVQLTEEEFDVLRRKGTEHPYSGEYNTHNLKGTYCCKGCEEELFTSEQKFNSHCGWPSFDDELSGNRIVKESDESHGMTRVEILCAKCGGHLGHLFNDGPSESGLRYCVNSLSLSFKEDS
jgi:peptide-methionine (R)-S-oxide reductase